MNAAYFDQFNMNSLIHFQISKNSMTISNLIMTLTISLMTLKILLKQNKMIPNQLELLMEIMHNSIKNMCTEHLNKNNNMYFPLMLSFFMLMTCINLTGILPYVFTLTSHISMTLTLSFSMLLTATLTGFKKWNTKFLSMLTPQSAPLMLTPFLMLMETMSYITRIISLSMRLTANMSAGHLLFTMLSSFMTETMNNNLYLMSMIPITVLTFIIILEIMVAIMQAYVFTLLTTMYLSDAMKLH